MSDKPPTKAEIDAELRKLFEQVKGPIEFRTPKRRELYLQEIKQKIDILKNMKGGLMFLYGQADKLFMKSIIFKHNRGIMKTIMRFLFLFVPFSFCLLSVAKPSISIQNFSQDKDATHKALDYDRERELRGEKKAVRLELKAYRQKIYALKKEIAYEKEQAREYIAEIKALKAELKDDIKKRDNLKETVGNPAGGILSFASQVTLGGDVTDRQGDKHRLHAYNQLIKVKQKKIRELRAWARKFLKNRKVKKLEIAELRNEMAILSNSHGMKVKPVTRRTIRNIASE